MSKNKYMLDAEFDLRGDDLVIPICLRFLGTLAAGGTSLATTSKTIFDLASQNTDTNTAVTAAAAIASGVLCTKFAMSCKRLNRQYRNIINSDGFQSHYEFQERQTLNQ